MAERSPRTSLSTNPDDSSGYRRTTGGGRRRSAGGGGGTGKMIGINLILAMLVAGLVISGWFIANQHQLLTAEKQALDAAESRIAVLEGQAAGHRRDAHRFRGGYPGEDRFLGERDPKTLGGLQ